jgi:hypothetical protein
MANLVVIEVYLMFYLFQLLYYRARELDTVQIFGVVGNSCEVDWKKIVIFFFCLGHCCSNLVLQ